jgi:hypothetical protein
MLKNVVVYFFIALVILINVSSYFDVTQPLFRHLSTNYIRSFGLAQRWNMFSPNPTTKNPFTLIVGETEQGVFINLRTKEVVDYSKLDSPGKIPLGQNYLSYYLNQMGAFIHFEETKQFGYAFMDDLSNYFLKKWYQSGGQKIKRVMFVQVLLTTLEPGVIAPPEVFLLHDIKYK